MEEQLNAARREQAKASIALQQSRREAVRERERLLQGMELEREALEGEVEACKAKLASVMVERNLLVVRLSGQVEGWEGWSGVLGAWDELEGRKV